MADGVDAAEHAVKAARGEPPGDLPAAKAERDELFPRNDPVLPSRNLGDDEVDWSI